LIASEKPDAILLFTDPHCWEWLFVHEHEIRKQIPILYYHVWDNIPAPQWNKKYYESCDWIGCISKLTYGVVKNVVTNPNIKIDYVPHGVNSDIFKPLTNIPTEFKEKILGDNEYDFILFYNNRNIRRKQTSDIIYSFKMFFDSLPKKLADKCLLLMHTHKIDNNGTNLVKVIEDLTPSVNVKLIDQEFSQEEINWLYNIADCTINIASNEGFGLGTLESIMSGTPIIVNVTGGLQDQCGFNYDEDEYIVLGSLHKTKQNKYGSWVTPICSSSINLNGSPATPYLFEDKVSHEEVFKAILSSYFNFTKDDCLKGREYALNNFSSDIMGEKISDGINYILNNFKPKNNYEIIKIY
jgi:glycosyltransferase involved in cell wall biosynthesis